MSLCLMFSPLNIVQKTRKPFHRALQHVISKKKYHLKTNAFRTPHERNSGCAKTIHSQLNKHSCLVYLSSCYNSSSSDKTKRRDVSHIPDIKEFLSSTASPSQATLEHVPLEDEDTPPYLEKAKYVSPPFGKTVYFETYGCQMNVNDSEYAWAILKKDGYKRTDDLKKADVILLVTCSIREKAEEKIWSRLSVLKQLKQECHVSGYPKIGILGCMAERLKKNIIEKEKAVDIIAGPDAYRDLPRLLKEATLESSTAINVMLSVDETYADIMPVRFDEQSKTAFVSIMRGCDNMCSYCIVPFTRGRERSRPVESIIDEVRKLSDMGIKQVNLLGQNVNSYRDLSQVHHSSASIEPAPMSKGFKTIYKPKLGGLRFADLLDKVSNVDPEMRVRFISPHPKDFPDEVLKIISERPNICKQIHLPAQSGSSRILDLMRRGHTREDYLNLVDRVRSYIPNVSLSTDMIVGFCGETESDHLDSLSLIEMVKYDYAFLFKYSMRKKTHAYHKMDDNVPTSKKIRRLKEMMDLYYSLLPQVHSKYIGEIQLALVEKPSPKSSKNWISRNDGNVKIIIPDIPVLAGQTFSDKIAIKAGDYVAVKITSHKPNTYEGIPLYHSSIKDFYSGHGDVTRGYRHECR